MVYVCSRVIKCPFVESKESKSISFLLLTYALDSLEGLMFTAELRWLSVKGGGVGGHWSDVRSFQKVQVPSCPYIVDADMVAYRQGRTRKGPHFFYIDIS